MSDFTEIVPPLEPQQAEVAFNDWLSHNGDIRSRLTDEDVRIDTIRGPDGKTVRRYLVSRQVLNERR